jgi:isopentenyl phosphate kinase
MTDTHTKPLSIVKLGGSSITVKSQFETLNPKALKWVAQAIRLARMTEDKRFVIVHGAGSFGHHTAKSFGLSGKSMPPSVDEDVDCSNNRSMKYNNTCNSYQDCQEIQIQKQMQGLAETRSSVLKLNRAVVDAFLEEGIPAVGISPFSVGLQAHGGDEDGAMSSLARIVKSTIDTGYLVPVIHGDACLYGEREVGILSGDIIVAELAKMMSDLIQKDGSRHPHVNTIVKTIFLTDVDGVFTRDPATCTSNDSDNCLLPLILVDSEGHVVTTNVNASKSQHDCDVTGGFATKVGAAVTIARADGEVIVVKCGSEDAKLALCGKSFKKGTVIRKG